MSVGGPKIVAAVAIGAAGLVFAATAAQSERVRTAELTIAPIPVERSSAPETPQERRQHLNARMTEMLRSGEVARLVQPSASRLRVSKPRTAAVSPAATGGTPPRVVDFAVANANSADDGYRSTIAPPAFTGGTLSRTGRGYTAPHLDLTTPARVPANDIECLTQAVYYEARNESAEGQTNVAEVVINRSRSGAYPRSVCAVVYQRNSRTCQFTFTCDGAIGRYPVDMRKWARAERIAREAYEGRSAPLLPSNSVNYHANYVRPSWGSRLERVRQIGAHIFYGAARGGGGSTIGPATPYERAQVPAQGLQFVRIAALDRAFQALNDAPVQPETRDAAQRP